MRFHRALGSIGATLALLLALGACSSDATGIENQAGSSSGDTTEASQPATAAASGTTSGSDSEETGEQGAQPQVSIYETYDEWRGHELAPLVPSPEDLGPGWNNFSLRLLSDAPLFDPSDEQEGEGCGLTEPAVLRDGFYAEHGYGESPDDAVVLVSRGTTDQLRATYEGLRILFECPAQNDTLGTVFRPKPAPVLPGGDRVHPIHDRR